MQVRFWGTRGSIPKCGPQVLRYGGSTPCIEVLTDAGTLIVIDCGSGGHALGQSLQGTGRGDRGHLLISHTHWDHIQGLPFFAPLFVPGNQWEIYAPRGTPEKGADPAILPTSRYWSAEYPAGTCTVDPSGSVRTGLIEKLSCRTPLHPA